MAFCHYYHEKTKYTREGLARSGRQLDWSSQPLPYKDYTTGQKIDLKSYLPGQPGAADGVELSQISKLLYFTYGITAVIPYAQRPFYMRAAPSAGGLYPAEIYLISRGTPSLPIGIYNYQVLSHSLLHFWEKSTFAALEASCFDHPSLLACDLALVVTEVFFRRSEEHTSELQSR